MLNYHHDMAISEKVRQVAAGYAELNDEERHEFVALVAPSDDEEVSQEWLKELDSRADDIDSGRVQLIDGDDFLRRLRAV
jgi:hypothetical protein